MNRAKEIQEIIDKLEENHRIEVTTLKNELRDIRRQCQHLNKEIVGAISGCCKYACDDCGDSWWD